VAGNADHGPDMSTSTVSGSITLTAFTSLNTKMNSCGERPLKAPRYASRLSLTTAAVSASVVERDTRTQLDRPGREGRVGRDRLREVRHVVGRSRRARSACRRRHARPGCPRSPAAPQETESARGLGRQTPRDGATKLGAALVGGQVLASVVTVVVLGRAVAAATAAARRPRLIRRQALHGARAVPVGHGPPVARHSGTRCCTAGCGYLSCVGSLGGSWSGS